MVGLAILGVIINLGLIVATVMLTPDMQNSCQVQHDCKSQGPELVKYHSHAKVARRAITAQLDFRA